MMRPSGTVTFLFTDIEGSTLRWESDPEAMRAALAAHDRVLRDAIEAHSGWLFKHTGDGVCAAFSAAAEAVAAAVDAQRRLDLPVRMGIGTGFAELRGEDYLGPALNRAARVMAAGHGGQVLVAASTAALVDGVDLVDLGEHHLRDLSGAYRLFQVRAHGLAEVFAPLRTLDAVPGNLRAQATTLVGRDVEVKELIELTRAHRMVTMTGVGGVGKTRLAVQVAAEMTGEFPDGVWLVELAPVGDPAALPDAVASALGVTPRAGMSVTASIALALSGRRLLIVLDNCEHLLDASADLVEAILARASTVTVLATSREGLRVGAEQLWVVPSLDVGAGAASVAVELFVERARSVNAGFGLRSDADAAAVTEICARLDGIALAIELAAARMVSMSPQDVRDHLGDRLRLLSGARRGLVRHQTLRHAVDWSYDLLNAEERVVLNRCSVFAGGFDLAAAAHLNDALDEYAVLDVLDSLVRKSLLTVGQVNGHTRYGLLETIRQFAEEHLARSGLIDQVRDSHAAFYGGEAVAYWELWDGPQQLVALDWVDSEFANLRAGFRWATDRRTTVIAAAIAAHTTMLGWAMQRLEPVGWAEEILPAATTADLAHLPRLYTAASLCAFTGHPEAGVHYAETATAMEMDPRYDPFSNSLSRLWEATTHIYAGRLEQSLEIFTGLAAGTGPAHARARCGETLILALLGRNEEAVEIADETLAAARADANPFYVAHALCAYSLAYATTEPARALESFSQGLAYARQHRLRVWEHVITRDAASVEAQHGDLDRALTLLDSAIDSLHQAGNIAQLAMALARLVVVFDRLEYPEVAATIYGGTTEHPSTNVVADLPGVIDHLREVLGVLAFRRSATAGAEMEPADLVRYTRDQIALARQARAQPDHRDSKDGRKT